MPCIFCEAEYFIMPCESDGILTKEKINFKAGFIATTTEDEDNILEQLSLFFKREKDHCPCKNCLVKMICIKTLDCKDYNDFIDKIYREETFGEEFK